MTNSEHIGPDKQGYERRDANLRWVFGISLVGVILIVAVVVFLREYFVITREQFVYESVLKPESAKFRELRAREDEVLNSFGIIDAQKGIYRIPINRAMQITAEEAFSQRSK